MFGQAIDKYAAPENAFTLAGRLSPWFGWVTLLLLFAGLWDSLFLAPADEEQGESYRIIFLHVPAAWMSMFIYVIMAGAGAVGLVWKVKLMDAVARASAPTGAIFTFLTLITGMLWGKPMWGTWWVWDARLTSELILLFLYLGYIALQAAIDDRRTAARAGAVLALVGVVNIPIIHYSVMWWNTLHQGPTIARAGGPAIHISMLIPLLIMAVGFTTYYLTVLMHQVRCEILEQEKNSSWVRALAAGGE